MYFVLARTLCFWLRLRRLRRLRRLGRDIFFFSSIMKRTRAVGDPSSSGIDGFRDEERTGREEKTPCRVLPLELPSERKRDREIMRDEKERAIDKERRESEREGERERVSER